MSDSIWRTDDLREASTKKLIMYFACGCRIPYTGWNHPDIMMLSASNESWWNYTDVVRWCYVDDIIAQADKAERLQKAVDCSLKWLHTTATARHPTTTYYNLDAQTAIDEIEQLIKDE